MSQAIRVKSAKIWVATSEERAEIAHRIVGIDRMNE